MAASIGSGLRVVVPTLGLALLLLLVTVALRFGVFLGAAMLDATTGSAAVDAILHTGAYVALAGWIASMWFVATQALVVERLGPVRALRRSVRLTAGSRWRVFGLYVLLVLAYLLASWLLGLVFRDAASWGEVQAWVWCSGALPALSAAFIAVCATVAYHDLRQSHDGVDVDTLMRVFE